jgi:hypothetical protein
MKLMITSSHQVGAGMCFIANILQHTKATSSGTRQRRPSTQLIRASRSSTCSCEGEGKRHVPMAIRDQETASPHTPKQMHPRGRLAEGRGRGGLGKPPARMPLGFHFPDQPIRIQEGELRKYRHIHLDVRNAAHREPCKQMGEYKASQPELTMPGSVLWPPSSPTNTPAKKRTAGSR